MKLTLLCVGALQLPVVLATRHLSDPIYRRDNGTEAQQELMQGANNAIACFDIALDKAGYKKAGTKVPEQPAGINCDAVIKAAKAQPSAGMAAPTGGMMYR